MSMKINDYEFIYMEGDLGAYANQNQENSRWGVDGHSFRKLGRRGSRGTVVTRSTFSSIEEARNTITGYEQLQSEFATFIKGNRTIPQIFVHSVTCGDVRGLAVSSDGKSYLVETSWNIQRTLE